MKQKALGSGETRKLLVAFIAVLLMLVFAFYVLGHFLYHWF